MIEYRRIVETIMCASARFIAGVSARWVDCEPSTRQRIYYANHSSHLDILILWSSLPRDVRRVTRPVAASDYWLTSRFKSYLVRDVFNAIMVQRSGHGGSFRDAIKAIEDTLQGMGEKYSLIIFPEGTRNEGGEPADFKGGIHKLAQSKPGIELVPVFMENLNRILPKGELFPVPIVGSISFGPPITLGEGESKKDFLVRARQAIIDLQEI